MIWIMVQAIFYIVSIAFSILIIIGLIKSIDKDDFPLNGENI